MGLGVSLYNALTLPVIKESTGVGSNLVMAVLTYSIHVRRTEINNNGHSSSESRPINGKYMVKVNCKKTLKQVSEWLSACRPLVREMRRTKMELQDDCTCT